MSNIITLKQQFLNYIDENYKKTPPIIHQDIDGLTLATFNVHYWTDVYEIDKSNGIIQDILNIKADIIILQEVALGDFEINNNKIYGNNVVKILASNGYKKQILCNTVPSWWNVPYGNILLVHDKFIDKIGCDSVCSVLNETNYTFAKSSKTVVVSGKHEGTLETRCYIKITIPGIIKGGKDITIYGTHLDVASEYTREEQIQHIIDDANKVKDQCIVIMGDFNTIDDEQYMTNPQILNNLKSINQNEFRVINTLKKNGFEDAFKVAKKEFPEMTTWNNTRVDFIFIKNISIDDIQHIRPVYTKNSDHIPIVIKLHLNKPQTGGNNKQIIAYKTKDTIKYNGKTHLIYEGKRGAKYISLNKEFINIRKLKVS